MLAKFSISPTELWHSIGTANTLRLIDVRRRDIYESTPGLLPASMWRDPAEFAHWSAALDRERPDRGGLQVRQGA
jgi:hypothetical protein